MTDLSFNVLAQTVADTRLLRDRLNTLRPRAVLIMDGLGLARELAQRHKAMLVIHRQWNENDREWHNQGVSAAQWFEMVRGHGANNVVVQFMNEPSGYVNLERLVPFLVDGMEIASRAGVRLCVGNFGVYHPDKAAIERGAFDPLLRAFARMPQHVLGLHEYFTSDPLSEREQIGRSQLWVTRARQLGIQPPLIVVTECGRDIGGGPGDGWRSTGWTAQEYDNRLRAMAGIMNGAGVYSACIYSYGPGFGWRSFDISHNHTLIDHIQRFTEHVNGGHVTARRVAETMRVRQLPTVHSPQIGRVLRWFQARYYPARSIRRDGYTWFPLVGGGWIAGEPARLVEG